MRRTPTTPTANHKNKWEGAGLMDGDYVVGVTAISYPGCSDNQNCLQRGYHILHHNWRHPALHVSKLHKNVLSSIGEKMEISVLQTSSICIQIFVQGKLREFIHVSTYTYNEVMRILELAGVVECE